MSGLLNSLLGNVTLDKDLDDLFRSGPTTPAVAAPAVSVPETRKRKQQAVANDGEEEGAKTAKVEGGKKKKSKEVKTEEKKDSDAPSKKKAKLTEPEPTPPQPATSETSQSSKPNKRKAAPSSSPSSSAKKPKTVSAKSLPDQVQEEKTRVLEELAKKRRKELGEDVSDSDSEKKDGKVSRRQKRADKDEKNERTVFVGNLSIAVTEKAGVKELKTLFSKHGKLESIRFRSIAFADTKPRKASFVHKEFHPDRDTLNAYIVYADPSSLDAAIKENGTVFMGKHIRVDKVSKEGVKHDPKRSAFVGNLPFDIDEESLWEFFAECGDVENVRVIRDRSTNVGKGFAYVQFKDRAAVSLAIKKHENELKGRKVRVTRCNKDLANGKKASATEGTRAKRPTTTAGGSKKPGGLLKKAVGGLKKAGLMKGGAKAGGKGKGKTIFKKGPNTGKPKKAPSKKSKSA
ncbi:Nucleolar protein 12 [Rhizophlyctis rosea]|nr:Nucleolar protein 12 [Rhizophlyctis rosea]